MGEGCVTHPTRNMSTCSHFARLHQNEATVRSHCSLRFSEHVVEHHLNTSGLPRSERGPRRTEEAWIPCLLHLDLGGHVRNKTAVIQGIGHAAVLHLRAEAEAWVPLL